MNFDLYLKTRKTFPSPEGPAVLELRLDNTCLTDFETLLAGIAANTSQLLARHDNAGLVAWVSSFSPASGGSLRCAITKEWFPEKQATDCVTELTEVFAKALSTYNELKEEDEDAFERFEEKDVPELIRQHFDISSILLDDDYEMSMADINASDFFDTLFEASGIIDDINLTLSPDNEESLRIYCEDRHCGIDFISSLNPKRFYDNVVVYADKEDYARNWIDGIANIPPVIEHNINWEGVYDDLTNCSDLELVEHEGTIYDFTNI